jgi:hypothetical protein
MLLPPWDTLRPFWVSKLFIVSSFTGAGKWADGRAKISGADRTLAARAKDDKEPLNLRNFYL